LTEKITHAGEIGHLHLIRLLFVILMTLQLADWDSSIRALQMGRQEQNVLIQFIAHYVGLLVAVTITKLAALMLTWIYINVATSRLNKNILLPLSIVTAIYSGIVINNYS